MKEFEEFKIIHYFLYPNNTLKGWITPDNFINPYKTDWDSLMEVVEKIESLEMPNTEYSASISVVIYDKSCEIEYDGYNAGTIIKQEQDEFYSTKINAVYSAVVKFIEWYNEQKK